MLATLNKDIENDLAKAEQNLELGSTEELQLVHGGTKNQLALVQIYYLTSKFFVCRPVGHWGIRVVGIGKMGGPSLGDSCDFPMPTNPKLPPRLAFS